VPQRILVLGASGYIGQHLVCALSQQGHQVRAAARHISRLQKRHLPGVTCHAVDLNWPEALAALLTNIDIVYYLVHAMGEGGDFVAHERQVALNVRDALRDTPVKQMIFLSSLQAPEDEQSDHLRARQLTGDILRDAGPATPPGVGAPRAGSRRAGGAELPATVRSFYGGQRASSSAHSHPSPYPPDFGLVFTGDHLCAADHREGLDRGT